jgi:predicted glycogen debranching enzyme
VLTLQKSKSIRIASVSTLDKPIDELLTKEWLLTNECGSFASSTVIGCNTRGYHGLLIGSLNPPVNRIMALANCLEMVISPAGIFNLSTFEFPDKFVPVGFNYIKQFYQDTGVHFDYELNVEQFQTAGAESAFCKKKDTGSFGFGRLTTSLKKQTATIRLTKSIYLLRNENTVALKYDFTKVDEPVDFVLRPFVGLRDLHTMQKAYASLRSEWLGDGLVVRSGGGQSELFLSCPSMKPVRNHITRNNAIQKEKISNGVKFENDYQWWFNFVYRIDKERGQNFTEDLWTPGFFKCRIESPTELVLWANLSLPTANNKQRQLNISDINIVKEDLDRHQSEVISTAKACPTDKPLGRRADDRNLKLLCLAANQFVVKRRTDRNYRTTILAGFPWFADWGRDAFIALPGLLLSTGRFDEAKSVLTTFAQSADEGMIPNRFDDRSDTAYFNSIDASLWFINAAFQYLHSTGDSRTFTQELLPIIRWIVDSYQKGTRFDIHADNDGLITAGNADTQLTWMDAKYNGVAFTPRFGKAVEINALWYNSLCLLAEFYVERNSENAKQYKSMAEQVGVAFCNLFWNEAAGYLNDCILPGGTADASLRPNQIFAVSLSFSPPLSPRQQKSIVDCVQKELLTPFGLRTLNVQSPNYKGIYTGPQGQRDEAYHQGTVWPYLMGPFVEAYLKINEFSRKSKKTAAEFIQPLLRHLTEDACLGQVSEIFDGDAPHKPKGCFAQAWSVAELLRAYLLINS